MAKTYSGEHIFAGKPPTLSGTAWDDLDFAMSIRTGAGADRRRRLPERRGGGHDLWLCVLLEQLRGLGHPRVGPVLPHVPSRGPVQLQ